jgi:DNA recombination protein RmuC
MEIALGIGIVLVLGIVIWILVQWLSSMQKTVQGSSGEVSRRLSELNRQIGEISELGRGIKSLQEFLQSPKLRGNIGEQVLKDMIGQSFPKNSFHLQYSFKSGMKVDAVLKTDAGLLCIDSKFPMENFTLMHRGETEAVRAAAKRDFAADVKKHITDISKKYILPEEGTMDFALMYIPSESVYYEIATMEDLMTFARQNRVYPVSPNTLYAHLQVLLLSFQGKELEQKSREVFRLLRAIQKDYEKTGEQLNVLGHHIGNAYNTMSGVSGSFDVLGQKLSKTQELKELEEK